MNDPVLVSEEGLQIEHRETRHSYYVRLIGWPHKVVAQARHEIQMGKVVVSARASKKFRWMMLQLRAER